MERGGLGGRGKGMRWNWQKTKEEELEVNGWGAGGEGEAVLTDFRLLVREMHGVTRLISSQCYRQNQSELAVQSVVHSRKNAPFEQMPSPSLTLKFLHKYFSLV